MHCRSGIGLRVIVATGTFNQGAGHGGQAVVCPFTGNRAVRASGYAAVRSSVGRRLSVVSCTAGGS